MTAPTRRSRREIGRPRRLQEPALAGKEERLILIGAQGYSSSLAAIRLHEIGYAETTDVIGGFEAWAEAGLPVERSEHEIIEATPLPHRP